MKSKKIPRTLGSTLDSFLDEEGILAEADAAAIKSVLSWKLKQAMKKKRLTKESVAKKMKTSRSQLDRLLDPNYTGVTLSSITRASKVLGLRLQYFVVDNEKPKQIKKRAA